MYIRRIRIENVRGFGSGPLAVDLGLRRPDGRLAGWTVLAGRNGSGKTTLLQAVALTLLPRSLPFVVNMGSWVRHGETKAEVRLDLEKGQLDSPADVKKNETVALSFKSTKHRSSNLSINGTLLTPGCDFVAAYGSFRRLSGHTSEAQNFMSDTSGASRVVTLFREDASLAEGVQWLREVYLRRLEEKPGARELEQAAFELIQDGLLADGARIERIDSEGLWVDHNGVSMPLGELSEGYRSVAALVLDILRHLHATFGELRLENGDGQPIVPYDGVVLIDEIDSHLHVSWQQRIGFWLKEHFPNIQFLVTTHSPFICQAADPRGLIRLSAPSEQRAPEHVPDELFHTVVNGTPDDAAMEDLFGLEHPYSERSERLRQKLARLEFKLLRSEITAEEREEMKALEAQLPRTGSATVERALRKLRETG